MPDTFLNLRVDPLRMLRRSKEEIRNDVESLVAAVRRGPAKPRFGLCSINMDYGTPDENVMTLYGCAKRR